MLSSCDRATRLLSVMVKVTESTLSAESGCKRRLLGSKFCSRTLARKLRMDVFFRSSHREDHEDAQAGRGRDLIEPDAEGKSRAGAGPETGRRGQTLDLVALGHNDRTSAQKADAVDDLGP